MCSQYHNHIIESKDLYTTKTPRLHMCGAIRFENLFLTHMAHMAHHYNQVEIQKNQTYSV